MQLGLGRRIAPPRFVAFGLILAGGAAVLCPALGWRHGTMGSFDVAAAIFLLSLWPVLRRSRTADMRVQARRNDANRGALLAVTAAVSLTILVAVGSELIEKGTPKPTAILLIVGTLALSWLFANMVYALHYAHLFYSEGEGGDDAGGIDFPGTREPGYWDFIYFSFTLGMTFQTSDTDMTVTGIRVVAIFQCLAAFVFNIGVLAFTINVLGGG